MKEERKNIISYKDIKEDEYFYMPVNIDQFRYISPSINKFNSEKMIIFTTSYGTFRYFSNLLVCKNSPVLNAFDNSYDRNFIFQKIKGRYIYEPITNTIFTLDGNNITKDNRNLDDMINYNEAKEYIDFYENNPVAIQCYSDQKFYLPNENIVIEQSEELEKAIEYIVATAKDISKEEYEKLKENKEQKAKRYIKFIQNNI